MNKDKVTSWDYIKENWKKDERLALVMVNKEKNDVIQKFVKAGDLATEKYQKYLRYMNVNGYNIYVSMNAIKDGENSRTKDAIKDVSHVYLDIDSNGKKVLEEINKDVNAGKLPQPNYVIETSRNKFQVIWKTQGFNKQEAENLMRVMADKYGTDKAATDISRVLRIPGFHNKKYAEPFRVRAERLTNDIYSPENFKIERVKNGSKEIDNIKKQIPVNRVKEKNKLKEEKTHNLSLSEIDWYRTIQRVLNRDLLRNIAKDLAKERQDKPNPEYYATLTTAKAYAKISADRGTDPNKVKTVIEKEFKDMPNIKEISEHAVKEYYQRGKER